MQRKKLSNLIGNKLLLDRPTDIELRDLQTTKNHHVLVLRQNGSVVAIINDEHFFDRDGNRLEMDV